MSTITPPRRPIATGSGLIPGLSLILNAFAGQGHGPGARSARRVAREPQRKPRILWAPAGGGHRERARRVRQIRAGTLTASNGLVITVADEGQP